MIWGYRQVIDNYFYPKNTRSELNEISAALERYYESKKAFPETLAEFIDAMPTRESWKLDAWGNPYEYEHKDSNVYTVSSAGRDGWIGTDDDIKVSNIKNLSYVA